ncbi:hypothetical protein Pfo_011042 [Paulownia fortunei]|nr:hypothetical protein Pfo_011042 [Paulownia fortunei]
MEFLPSKSAPLPPLISSKIPPPPPLPINSGKVTQLPPPELPMGSIRSPQLTPRPPPPPPPPPPFSSSKKSPPTPPLHLLRNFATFSSSTAKQASSKKFPPTPPPPPPSMGTLPPPALPLPNKSKIPTPLPPPVISSKIPPPPQPPRLPINSGNVSPLKPAELPMGSLRGPQLTPRPPPPPPPPPLGSSKKFPPPSKGTLPPPAPPLPNKSKVPTPTPPPPPSSKSSHSSQKQESQSRPPEIDVSKLDSLFSVASASDGANKCGGPSGSKLNKPKVQLNAILALDSSALDIDQLENFIKFCPTKEEMEMLKNYNGDKEMLGKCEQFFLELMKVPRVESRLRVFAFTITFTSQVENLKLNLNTIKDAAAEIKESMKLRQIMQKILTLGNPYNRGSRAWVPERLTLDSLLELSDTHASNNKMALMHHICKILAQRMPELLDFSKDLAHLEPASKIQLVSLAKEMQAVMKGLEKVHYELTAAENDGAVSSGFRKVLKSFLDSAEAEVRALTTLYTEAGRTADALALYFLHDPERYPFERVMQILVVFAEMLSNKARD